MIDKEVKQMIDDFLLTKGRADKVRIRILSLLSNKHIEKYFIKQAYRTLLSCKTWFDVFTVISRTFDPYQDHPQGTERIARNPLIRRAMYELIGHGGVPHDRMDASYLEDSLRWMDIDLKKIAVRIKKHWYGDEEIEYEVNKTKDELLEELS